MIGLLRTYLAPYRGRLLVVMGLLLIQAIGNLYLPELNGDIITVTGQLQVQFADYDIEKPSAAIVLSVDDKGIIEVQLFFTKA